VLKFLHDTIPQAGGFLFAVAVAGMQALLLVCFTLLHAGYLHAQSYPTLERQAFYGSAENETAVRLLKGTDRSLILVGNLLPEGGNVPFSTSGNLICIDPLTNTQRWSKTLAPGIQLTDGAWADTSLFVTGIQHTPVHGKQDVLRPQVNAYLAKLHTSTGAHLWERMLGGSEADVAYAVTASAGAGCTIAGYSWSSDPPISPTGSQTESNCLFARYAAQGQPLRYQLYGGSSVEWISTMAQTGTGGYLLAGITHSTDWEGTPAGAPFVLRTDEWGTVLWRYTYRQAGSYTVARVISTYDGGAMLAGSSTEAGMGSQFWLLRLNANGEMIFSKTYGDYGQESLSSIAECSDHGVIAVGTAYYENGKTPYFKGGQDVWLLRLDASGNLIWQQGYGGPFNETGADVMEFAPSVFYALGTKENRFISGEKRKQDYWLVKVTEQPCSTLLAKFSVRDDQTEVIVGQALQFLPAADESSDSSTPDRWVWDFGDGTRSTEHSPTKRYKKAGRFIVRLTVYKNENCRVSWQLPQPLEIKEP